MRPIDADALIEVVEKSMAENPHKEKTQRAMHIHEHKYFLTLLAGIPTIQPVATDTNVGDTISRQQAIRWVKTECNPYGKPTLEFESGKKVIEHLEQMPPAQPERKKGKWIYNSPVTMKCDQCGLVIKDWDWHRFKFCPNCDCDMRGEQE